MLAPTICQSAREAPQCPQDSLRRSASCRPCGHSPGPRPSAPANAVTLPAGSPAKSLPARSPPGAAAPGFLRWRSASDHPALPSLPVRKSARTVSYSLPMLDVKWEKCKQSLAPAPSDLRWHRPCFNLRPAPLNTLPSTPSDRHSAHTCPSYALPASRSK